MKSLLVASSRGLLVAVLTTVFLAACGSEVFDDDCSHEMDDLREERGEPEEIQRFDSGDYHSHTWWYWRRGFSRNFTWGGPVDDCETSDYTFTPIGAMGVPER